MLSRLAVRSLAPAAAVPSAIAPPAVWCQHQRQHYSNSRGKRDSSRPDDGQVRSNRSSPHSSSQSGPTRSSDPVSRPHRTSDTPQDPAPKAAQQRAGQDQASRSQPQKPLPDLRHGIPSTFAKEFMDKARESQAAAEEGQESAPESASDADAAGSEGMAGQASSRGGSGRRGGDGGEFPRSAYETSNDRRRNRIANYAYLSVAGAIIASSVFAGRNWDTKEEEAAHPDAPSGWGVKMFYNRIRARFAGQMGYYTEPTFEKLLPEQKDPEGNPLKEPQLTLVMSLEDMLIHSEWSREHGWRTAKRPDMDYFIRYLMSYYELVLWTSLPYATAEPILRKLDPYTLIRFPLFREATRYERGQHVKDLRYLNRDPSKIVVVDTKPAHSKQQPENSIIIPPWKGDPANRDLAALVPFLESLATMGSTDTREVLKTYKGKNIPHEFAERETRVREAHRQRMEEDRRLHPHRGRANPLASLLGVKPRTATLVGPDGQPIPGLTNPSEGLAQGKLPIDFVRERGQANYNFMETQIREQGAQWLKENEAQDKKMMEEQNKEMQNSFFGFFGMGKKAKDQKEGDGK